MSDHFIFTLSSFTCGFLGPECQHRWDLFFIFMGRRYDWSEVIRRLCSVSFFLNGMGVAWQGGLFFLSSGRDFRFGSDVLASTLTLLISYSRAQLYIWILEEGKNYFRRHWKMNVYEALRFNRNRGSGIVIRGPSFLLCLWAFSTFFLFRLCTVLRVKTAD